MRYFLAVAQFENIHAAARNVHVSTGSLSKAVSRLEAELGVNLFYRDGRNIYLTEHGRLFQKRVSQIVNLEESVKVEIAGHKGALNVVLSGPEVVLSHFGVTLTEKLKKHISRSSFEYLATSEDEALKEVERGNAHMALITHDSPTGLTSKVIGSTSFQTYVGQKHPLYSNARSKKAIAIQEVLKHSFVSPSHGFFGVVHAKQSLDGWRDDKFQRKIEHVASSLKIIEELVVSGRVLAYLPDYFARKLALLPLNVLGCPYTCSQKIKLVARNPQDHSWLNQIF